MEKIDLKSLRKILMKIKLVDSSYQECIDWAVEELQKGIEDENVCILASSNINNMYEVETYLRKIVGSSLDFDSKELQEVAGAIVVEMGQKYLSDDIDIFRLESIVDRLYVNLGYPDWLVMLARNCEYATDIDYFMTPFIQELKYIIELWSEFPKYEEFALHYDRKRSNMHT